MTSLAGASAVDSIHDARFLGVVGRHLDFDAVTGDQTDESLPHFPGNVREDEVAIVQLDSEHGSRKNGVNRSFQLYSIVVFIHNCDGAEYRSVLRF